MKRFLFHALVVAFLAAPAFADLYQWNDERGVIHITDSMEKVPSKFRGGVRVIKEGPSEAPAPEKEAAPAGDNGSVEDTTTDLDQGAAPAEELYGDEPLGWWTQSFQDKRAEISGLQESIDAKTKFIEVFEGGRRFGQVFDSESVEKYKMSKEELPEDLKKLSTLKEEYTEFQDKATRAGVPRDIREP